jgi:hypothetical protein
MITRKIGCILALLFHFTSCQNASNKENIESNEALQNKKNYTIDYDSSFTLDESKKNGTEFYLFSNKIKPQPDFVANLNLMIQNLEGLNYNLDQFIALSEKQIKPDGKLLSSERIKTVTSEYHVLLFEANFNGMDLKFLQYDFVKADKAYVLTFSSKSNDFDSNLIIFEKVLNSFKVQ